MNSAIWLIFFCLLTINHAQNDGDLRIMDGTASYGRLEIYYSGSWGTICDDYFDFNDFAATVACRQLGYTSGINYEPTAGTGTIWLDDVQCTGDEYSITACPSGAWGSHNCGHSEDAGVSCSGWVGILGYTNVDIVQNQQTIMGDLFDIKLLLASKANETIDELKDHLDDLHSRVQLRPTSAPTLSPTVPSAPPTTALPSEYPTRSPSAEPTVEPTMPTTAPTMTWVDGLTLGGSDNTYNGEFIDDANFNTIFQNSDYHIIRRECSSCSDTYQELYYRRLTDLDSFDAYSYMRSWSIGDGNTLFQDFMIFTTIEGALTQSVAAMWYGCSDIPGSVSGFGHCYRYPSDYKNCQFALDAADANFDETDPCNKEVKFSIFVGEASYYGVSNPNAVSVRQLPLADNEGDLDYDRNNHYDQWNKGNDDGFEFKGNGNIQIVINAKEFDVGMIFITGLILIMLNVMIWKYGCCGCGNIANNKYKYGTVKFDDSEIESEEIPIKE